MNTNLYYAFFFYLSHIKIIQVKTNFTQALLNSNQYQFEIQISKGHNSRLFKFKIEPSLCRNFK